MPEYNPQFVEQLYNSICFRQDGCLEGLQVREFARKLWSAWENQQQQFNQGVAQNEQADCN